MSESFQEAWKQARLAAARGENFSTEVREGEDQIYLIAATPVLPAKAGPLVMAQQVSPDLAERAIKIAKQDSDYEQLSSRKNLVRGNLHS